MGNITDENRWENTIYAIDKQTPVLGGPDGSANRAAQQLANRTLWLKSKLQGMEGGETPYSDLDTVRDAIAAGKITDGICFSVRSTDPTVWVEEFKCAKGQPVATGKSVLAAEATELVVTPTQADPDGIITGLNQTVSGQTFRINTGETGDLSAIVYINDNGVARRLNAIAGAGVVRRFNETVMQGGKTAPYFAVSDRFGRIGRYFSAWDKNGEFGTRHARVSELGLTTPAATLSKNGLDTEKFAITTRLSERESIGGDLSSPAVSD